MRSLPDLPALTEVLVGFGCQAKPLRAVAWGDGHIHQTIKVEFGDETDQPTLLLQALNRTVFTDLDSLMGNLKAVTAFGQAKLRRLGVRDVERRMLTLLEATDGTTLVRRGPDAWRCFLFISNASSPQGMESEAQAFALSRTFGGFIELLSDFDASELAVTLPNFHDTPMRHAQLRAAALADCHGLSDQVQSELAFAEERSSLMGVIVDALACGGLPLRVTHNDTKLNNVLVDDRSGEALCVIDLDTVMAGSALYDFGDLVRTSVSASAEDTTQLDSVQARPQIFRGLVGGFVDALGASMAPLERELLFDSAVLITLEQGIRFLADHLQGDVYYGAQRVGHNLDRARAQFALVRSLESQADALRRLAREA